MKNNFIRIIFLTCMLSLAVAAVSYARDVTLQWDAVADTTVTGYKMYYKADSSTPPFNAAGSPVNVGKVTTGTVTGLDPARNYYFAVTAYNSAGAESPYSNIVSVLETIAPTASITSPAANAIASGTVSVTASATDNVGVTKVEFYLNGALVSTDTTAPYVYSWNTTSVAAGTYTWMVKAYDAAGNVGQSGSVAASVVKDTTAPTVSLTAPANNSTLSGTSTITASAADNIGVSKVEFYRSGVLLSATNVAPYSYSWNTASIANGSYVLNAKAYDAAGNIAQSANINVTVNNLVTTPPPTATATTIWAASTIPSVSAGADSPVQLGVKFRSDVSGYITGIRFYKAAGNTGTHVASLWSAGGTRLATATFTAETATGWQQVNFATPVAISANTVYVASYHTTVGYYGYTSGFFATSGIDNGNLHALASGVSGSNGVFAYGSSSLFPNQSWNNANYWVDVVFSAAATTPTPTPTDTIAPTVSVTAPGNNATVSGTVSVAASASDNVGVSKVEFYINGILKATDTAAPYNYSWNTTSAADGVYTTAAKAYDAAGNVGQSTNITVTVKNQVTTPPATTASTIWPATTIPAATEGADSPVQLGVKFRSDVMGYIQGCRK